MSTEVHTFKGSVDWLRREPQMFKDTNTGIESESWSFSFYPGDAGTRKAMAATGIKNNLKENDKGFYYTLRSKEPFPIDGVDAESLIGNGSEATVDLLVETFTSRKYGKVTRSKVVHVTVDKLVEFIPVEQPPKGLPV